MSFGCFDETQKKIAALERRVKVQRNLKTEVEWKRLVDYWKDTITSRQEKLRAEKKRFYQSSLEQAEKKHAPSDLQKVGRSILTRQETDVKALARQKKKTTATYQAGLKRFCGHDAALAKACGAVEKDWSEKERRHGQ